MNKIFIALCGVLVLSYSTANISAQEKKIAMLEPIFISEGIDPMVKFMVRGELTKSLTREDGFSAFTRTDVDKIVNEHQFQESGMVDEAQRRQLGQLEGVDYVCVSKISKAGDAYYIEASLVHIETGKIDNPGTAFAKGGIENVNRACQVVAADMVGLEIRVENTVAQKETPKPTTEPKKVDTNPNNFLILTVEANFVKHKIMVCDRPFTDDMTYAQAKTAVQNLNYGGYSDWRLPTMHEGMALHQNFGAINGLSMLCWTSTLGKNGYAYTYNKSYSDRLTGVFERWGVLAVRDWK